MTIKQQFIERFIRNNTPFHILTSTRHRLYVDPKQQKNYDGTTLKAQIGFPKATTTNPYLAQFYDSKLIKQTSFQTREEKLAYVDMILRESGFNASHRKNQNLIDELSNYLDELNKGSTEEITYYDIEMREINAIGFYSDDLFAMYDIWYPNLDKDIENSGVNFVIKDEQSNCEILKNIFHLCLKSKTNMYFKVNNYVLGEIHKLTNKVLPNKVAYFSNPLSIDLAKSFEIKNGYLFLRDYEMREEEWIKLLIIPIDLIATLGYLRAHGGAMVQWGYSKMPKWERIKRMYVESLVGPSCKPIGKALSVENKKFIEEQLEKEALKRAKL